MQNCGCGWVNDLLKAKLREVGFVAEVKMLIIILPRRIAEA